jgi:maltooligosyltrehalose trehalohydrolase
VELGAVPQGTTETRFTVWAPRAATVELWLTDTDRRLDMAPCGDGYFRVTAPCGTGARYRYRLDGSAELADPASRAQPDGVHGPSAVVDLRSRRWHDEGFVPPPLRDAVVYELHVGTFTERGTFATAAARLDDLVELGVTTIEVMPVAQFPGQRNWGYDGVFPFAVQHSYGGAAGLQEFVDACHTRGVSVLLDVVYNHLGPEGNVLGAFGPYFTDRYRTPWGEAVNLDGPGSDGVRSFFAANVTQWLTDFHLDGLRLDAVHELIDRSARPFLAELAALGAAIEEGGRRVVLIAESADNDPRVVTGREAGGLGMDAQWNDDFHHAVHVALTGEQNGYYGDYSGPEDVARAMGQGFVYQGQYSRFRRRRHGAPSVGLDPQRFVVFAQNHDQVGNRPDGGRLSSLVTPDQARLAAALLLLSPGVPLLFMGEEYGETAPFPYFVDHGDPALLQAVRRGRAAEHAHDPRADRAPDPGDPATFAAAKLDWSLRRSDDAHRELCALYRDLIALRSSEPALRRSSRAASVAHAEAGVVTLTRGHGGTTVVALFNLTPTAAIGHLDPGPCWTGLLPATAGVAPAPGGEVPLEPWGFRLYRAAAPAPAGAP